MAELLYSVFISFIYVISAINIGLLFFHILKAYNISFFSNEQIFAEVIMSILFGLGVLSNVWLLIGLFFNLNMYSILAVLLISIVLLLVIWSKYLNFANEIIRITKKLFLLKVEWKVIIFIIMITIILFGFGSALLPPRGDAEAFYMVWPKIISYTGTIIPQPNYYSFSQIGISGELHFATLMTLAGSQSATFLVWFVSLSVMGCVLIICSQLRIGLYGKIVALVIIITSTAFTYIIPSGNVNLFAAAYGLAAYYWVIAYSLKGQKSQLLFCGFFAGLSVVAKFSYLIVLLPGIGLIIILKYLYEGIKVKTLITNVAKSSLIVATAFILMLIPHLLKNYILFNEPFAPFLFLSNQEALGWVNQVWYTPEITRHILITYPIALSFGQYPMQGGNLSPLVLILLPLIFVAYKKYATFSSESLSFHIAIIGLISLVIWVALQPSILAPRYILGALFLFIFPVANSADIFMLSKDLKIYKSILTAILIWALLLMLPNNSYSSLRVIGSIGEKTTGSESVYYDSCIYVNDIVENNERLFFAGYYSYHLRPDILINLNGPADKAAIDENTNLRDKINQMVELGFAYLLVQKASHGSAFNIVMEEDRSEFQNVEIVFEDAYTLIYKLSSQ